MLARIQIIEQPLRVKRAAGSGDGHENFQAMCFVALKLWLNPTPQTSRARNNLSPFSHSAQWPRVQNCGNHFLRAHFIGELHHANRFAASRQ
jgi:hypothetical protein